MVCSLKGTSCRTVLTFAYRNLDVVYGDFSISPLYVYKSTFAEDIQPSHTNEENFGVLSYLLDSEPVPFVQLRVYSAES